MMNPSPGQAAYEAHYTARGFDVGIHWDARDPQDQEAWHAVAHAAIQAAAAESACADDATAEPEVLPMPPGRWGRVEMPGRREHTGWLNDELRYGADMLIVRDWNGAELTAVAIGPACRVVYLATPLHRPEQAPLALPAAHYDAWSGDYDEPEGPF